MSDAEGPLSAPDDTADRILSVTMSGWEVFEEASLNLVLGPQCTVLVGKNAAGKSVILESMLKGCLAATYNPGNLLPGPESGYVPYGMRVEFALGSELIAYEWSVVLGVDDAADDAALVWGESCRRIDTAEVIWQVENGMASFAGGGQLALPPDSSVLRLKGTAALAFPAEVRRIRRLLSRMALVRAGVPRVTARSLLRLPLHTRYAGRLELLLDTDRRMYKAMSNLVAWHEGDRERFESVIEVGRRLGVLEEVRVSIQPLEASMTKGQQPDAFATVQVDGCDFGYLSDGTLRVLEIIIGLVSPRTTVLLLEEPETAIHPGLLKRLLAEIEAHAFDRQIVISTHSPIIVDWANPKDIRLIERQDGHIQARSLDEDELRNIASYLEDNLTTSDFLYSGYSE